VDLLAWRGRDALATAGATPALPVQLIDLRGHDEVAFGQAVDFVRPQGDLGFAPGQQDIGMVALLLGHGSYAVHEGEGLLEIGKGEGAREVVLVDDLPVGELVAEVVEFRAFQGWDSTAAGDAGFAGEI